MTRAPRLLIARDRLCPFCRDRFTAGGLGVRCNDCRTLLHQDCWVEASGCTTFGCSPVTREPAIDERPLRRLPPLRSAAWSVPPPPAPVPLFRALRDSFHAVWPWRLTPEERERRDREALLALGLLAGLLVVLGLLALTSHTVRPRPTPARTPQLVTREIR